MDNSKTDAMHQWVARWQKAGPELERIRREELQKLAAKLNAAIDLGRRGHAGNERHVHRHRLDDQVRVQAGRHGKLHAGVDAAPELVRRQNRSRTDQHLLKAARHGADRLFRRRRKGLA